MFQVDQGVGGLGVGGDPPRGGRVGCAVKHGDVPLKTGGARRVDPLGQARAFKHGAAPGEGTDPVVRRGIARLHHAGVGRYVGVRLLQQDA